jgi:hypothetical protein
VIALAACGYSQPKDVGVVGGRVHGLWDGGGGVVLKLTANGVTTLLTVPTNGGFAFDPLLDGGASYAVSIESNPIRHTCEIIGGRNGAIAPGEGVPVDVACTGPDVGIELASAAPWMFDRSLDLSEITASVLVQRVSLIVRNGDGTIETAKVEGAPVVFGMASRAQDLALGTTSISVHVTARGGLSKTYELRIIRGYAEIAQTVYGKASNPDGLDCFGCSVAADGDTIAIGAPFEASSAIGVNPVGQSDNSLPHAGAVYVFRRTGGTWAQEAYLKASNTDFNDTFGYDVQLDGDTLVVAAERESSSARGINQGGVVTGNEADNSAPNSGAVYVFHRTGTTWAQEAYIKAPNADAGDYFGDEIALSGTLLAVGAPDEASSATGITDDPSGSTDNSAPSAGAVYVFRRETPGFWHFEAYIKPTGTKAGIKFGYGVALSGDTLAVTAGFDSSAATGVDPPNGEADTSAPEAGAVYVFRRSNATGSIAWSQEAYIKSSNTDAHDLFGFPLQVSGDTLAVAARGESSASSGFNGDQSNNSAPSAGAVYVFQRSGTKWTQDAYLKASNTDARDMFGMSVSLRGDLCAVAALDASNARGVNPDGQANNSLPFAGAAYLFQRVNSVWVQKAYIKASNPQVSGEFGGGLPGGAMWLSGDGLVIAATSEASSVPGIDPVGGESNMSAFGAGAMYVYR